MIVICPTRGRPGKALEAFEAFISTKTLSTTSMIFAVDPDDPTLAQYQEVPVLVVSKGGSGMGFPLNEAAMKLVDSADILGFVGDDHRFRTPGWDHAIRKALKAGGIAYGNDLGRPELPTQVFISSSIVKALGWMALPGAHHLYLDDTWAELGRRAGCLHYLEEVIIEHMHPEYGKASTDAGYQRVNAPSVYSHDNSLFRQWVDSGQADIDAATVRSVLQG